MTWFRCHIWRVIWDLFLSGAAARRSADSLLDDRPVA
jgi:hypothetical protein